MTLEEKDLKYIWHPCSQMKDYEEMPPIIIDHGKGVYLFDKNGKEYIDIHAIELVKDKDSKEGFASELRVGYRIYQEALKEGLLLRPLGNVLYFNPPLTISREEIDKSVERCVKAIDKYFG